MRYGRISVRREGGEMSRQNVRQAREGREQEKEGKCVCGWVGIHRDTEEECDKTRGTRKRKTPTDKRKRETLTDTVGETEWWGRNLGNSACVKVEDANVANSAALSRGGRGRGGAGSGWSGLVVRLSRASTASAASQPTVPLLVAVPVGVEDAGRGVKAGVVDAGAGVLKLLKLLSERRARLRRYVG
jgi:hypothetical protein